MMTKLAPELGKRVKERNALGREWLDRVKEKCPDVKFLAHYAILGQYDFIDIYEAPDDETAAKVSLISREYGAFEAQSLSAIPYKKFLKLIDEI